MQINEHPICVTRRPQFGNEIENVQKKKDEIKNLKTNVKEEVEKNMGASQNSVARHSQNFLAALSLHFRLMIYLFLLIERTLCKFVSGVYYKFLF